jgi:hypothetical protein
MPSEIRGLYMLRKNSVFGFCFERVRLDLAFVLKGHGFSFSRADKAGKMSPGL